MRVGDKVAYRGHEWTIEHINADGTMDLVGEIIPFMPMHMMGIRL